MKTFLQHLQDAYCKTGAPGQVTGYWADGRYTVRLAYFGALTKPIIRKIHRRHPDGRVTIIVNWSISGERQRKQATSDRDEE